MLQGRHQPEALQLPDSAGFHASPHPPHTSPRPWKASASPSARRASAMSLLVLSDEERAELDDCFDALASGGLICIKQISKAMELVLGPEQFSDKAAKAAFETMGPNISGNVDKAAFRAYMINNWALAAAPAAEVSGRRRSAQDWDVAPMRLSDIVRMYRRQTLGERTLKKAQQVLMHQAHGRGAGEGGGRPGKEAAGHDAWSFESRRRSFDHGSSGSLVEPRAVKRSFDSAAEALRGGGSSGGSRPGSSRAAVVPLSRFRRASLLMLEAALASEKTQPSTPLMGSVGSGELEPQPPRDLAPEPAPEPDHSSSCFSPAEGTVHEKPVDDAAQAVWEQQVLSLCCLDSGGASQVDMGDFIPVQQLLLSPQPPQTPDRPRGPRGAGPREGGPREGMPQEGAPREDRRRDGSSAASSDPQLSAEPDCSVPQLSSFSSDQITSSNPAPAAAKAAFSSGGGSGTGSGRQYSVHFTDCSLPPPDVARSLRSLGQQEFSSVAGGSWQHASPLPFELEGLNSDCSVDSYDSDEESEADSEASEVPPLGSASGSTGGVTSWVTKRLTRFVSRDEAGKADEPSSPAMPARGAASSSLLSTLGLRRNSLTVHTMQRSASLQAGAPLARPAGPGEEQRAMPLPAGAGVESMLRRVGCSQRGLLPSVCQGSQSGHASPTAYSPLASRSGTGMPIPSHLDVPMVAKPRAGVLGATRVDKAIADLQHKMNQKAKKVERWNLV